MPRDDVFCPRCGSLERHRHLWLFLRERTDLFSAERRVLHVSPEPCLEQRLSRLPNLDYVSIDLELGRAMVVADLTALQWADDSFDCILCVHVLEHIPDDVGAMRELRRVLAPGGWAVIQVPLGRGETVEDFDAPPAERHARFGDPTHVRAYGRANYEDRLRSAGFQLEFENFVLPEHDRERYRVVPRDMDPGDPRATEVFVCR
jgi:SAM-dependent methyltransferase